MKVSLITPTHQQRENHLRNLYQVFKAQTYPEVELLILDDSPQPSELFSTIVDDQIRYLHSAEKLTVGQKRNQLIEMAQGEIIMHFDDDDYYAPTYVEQMLKHLLDTHADFITLSGWYTYAELTQGFYYWDTSTVAGHHFKLSPGGEIEVISTQTIAEDDKYDWMTNVLWGYGFSYAYTKTLWQAIQFSDTVVGWNDFHFAMQVVNSGNFNPVCFPDQEGLVLHVIHDKNISKVLPQFILPNFLLPQIFDRSAIVQYLAMAKGGNERVKVQG